MKPAISGKKLIILLHLLVWVVLFILPAYLISADSPRDRAFLTEVWFQIAFYGIIFYVSYLWLAPGFFFKNRKIYFFLLSVLLIVVMTFAVGMINNYFDPAFRDHQHLPNNPPAMVAPGMPPSPVIVIHHRKPPPFKAWPLFNFMLTASVLTGLSLGIRFAEKLALNEKLQKEAEKEKLNTELSFLKHQINPHFLFNTLNSIYSLALTSSGKTAEAVMKLSDMMRYVLQDVASEKVPLEHELDYLQHYVELEKLRLSSNVAVDFTVNGSPAEYMIPPVILVPFVENAFKFGASAREPAQIRISTTIDNDQLDFHVFNFVFPNRMQQETFGIGIQNTRKRLELIYPGKHRLNLTRTDNHFIVDLMVKLK